MASRKKKKRKAESSIDISLIEKERRALKRRHRKVVLFNDRELSLIEEYCRSHKISSKSSMMRSIVMEKLLTDLGQNPPTLF